MSYCVRCNGQKFVFKVGGGYSLKNSGGKKMKCPLCMGSGEKIILEKSIDDIKNTLNKKESKHDEAKKRKRKIKNGSTDDIYA